MAATNFSARERRFLAGIGLVLGLRQLVLLLPLPFIAVYGRELPGSTPALVGLSLGIYGLLQAFLQVPFGRWSDVFGRKRMVLLGTVLLIVGLLLTAAADDIALFIVGRALQGTGAVTAVAYAWIADNTVVERRSRAMGIAGLAGGGAAIASFVVGPLLYSVLSLPQIFLLCAALAGVSAMYVVAGMREDAPRRADARAPAGLLGNADLRRLVAAGLLLNYVLMAVLFILPLQVDRAMGAAALWKILVPATVAGILVMRAATRLADGGRYTPVAALSFAAFVPAALCLSTEQPLPIAAGAVLFMAGYLNLFALLPAGVTRLADRAGMGTATGALYTALFLGSFAGGALTGILWGFDPAIAVAVMAAAAGLGVVAVLGLSNAVGVPASGAVAATAREER